MDPKKLEEAKKRLSKEQYYVCFLKGTEPPGTGKYTHHKDPGTYVCTVCRQPLFDSDAKFESNTGWPSFFGLVNKTAVNIEDDFSLGMHRLEVSCANCGSHLGHLFPDGPTPTGNRYCINSLALEFIPRPLRT